MTSSRFFSAIAVASLSFLAACGGGQASDDSAGDSVQASAVGGVGGSGASSQRVGGVGGSGVLSVATEQGCGLANVYVTIAGVRVNANGAADAASDGWVDVALAAPVRVDLLALASGVAFPVDLTSLPDGSYRQLRLLLVADDANAPLAESVVTASGVETALAVPDTAQGGLPLAAAITVAGGRLSASYRELDVCKAVTGTAGTYALGPVNAGATQVASAY